MEEEEDDEGGAGRRGAGGRAQSRDKRHGKACIAGGHPNAALSLDEESST